jgi:enoyl-CoA hydratase
MNGEDVVWELEGRVGTVTLQRVPVNAFRGQTWVELEEALVQLGDSRCSAVVLRSGLERIFSAGADVRQTPTTPAEWEARSRMTRRIFDRLLRFPVPIVCAVNGPAIAVGCVLAACADIRIATADATFSLPELNVGRIGGARHLLRVLPQDAVRRAYFTGKPFSADDAYRLGMVGELYPDFASLHEGAASIAGDIAAKSPVGVRLAKQSLDLAEGLPVMAGYEVEQQFSMRLAALPDAQEAVRAFQEKRAPVWADD